MKKLIITLIITVALAATWIVGRQSGIQHAITGSEIWLGECDERGDWIINIDLDGETYQHTLGMY